MLIASVLFAVCMGLDVDAPTARPQTPDHLAYPKGYKAIPGIPYWNISIPAPMSIEEWEGYGKVLRLSHEQRRALERIYDDYRRKDWAYRLEHVQSLYDRSAEIASQGVNHVSPELSAQRVELYRARDRILPGISNVEQELFARAAEFLGESQLDALETVRLMRKRANDRLFHSIYPGFHCDLDSAIIALADAGIDLTPDDDQAFSALMTSWRAAVGALYARHAQESRAGLAEGLVIRTDMFTAQESGQAELAADLERRVVRVRIPATRTARRILETSEAYVELVGQHLPSEARKRLDGDFQRAAYKPLPSDLFDLHRFFVLVEQQDLSLDQRQRVRDSREDWLVVDRAAHDRLRTEYLEWNEMTCTLRSYSPEDYANYSRRMLASFNSRVASVEELMAAILDILTKTQQRTIVKEIEKWNKAVERTRGDIEATKSRYGGWPAPME